MNLGEALSLLKKEKSRLSRFISLRKDNIFIEEGNKPEFDPKELSKEISLKIEIIRKLKLRIQKTNSETKLNNEKISIAEAIIKVGDIRSQIGALGSLFERRKSYWYLEKEQKKMIAVVNEAEVEKEIELLESEKTELDNKIQIANWNTKLIEL